MLNFVNKEPEKYYAVKNIKPRTNGRGGYVSLPKWLLGREVNINIVGSDEVIQKMVVSSMGKSVIFFPIMFLMLRVEISYNNKKLYSLEQ